MTRGGNLNPKLRVPLHHLMGCAPNGTPAYSNFSDDTFTNIENGPVPFVLHAHGHAAVASAAASPVNGDGESPSVAASAHLSESAAALIDAIVPHPDKATPQTGPATFGTGYKWQCVEFARRWLWDAKGLVLPDIPIAALIIHVPYVYRPDGTQAPVRAVWNGGTERPTADSLIIYRSRAGALVGHVGVIVEVTDTEVRVADQNRHFHAWGEHSYAAAFPLAQRDGRWYIEDPEEKVHGWLTFPDVPSVSKAELSGALAAPAPVEVPADEAAVPYRPVPPQMRYGVPEYSSAVSKQLWRSCIGAFYPTPLLFPFVLGFEVTKIATTMSARYVWGKIRPSPQSPRAAATPAEAVTNEAPISETPAAAAATTDAKSS